ncbi:glycosyltransferase [Ramlibacter sp. 2FC]|uniref:glycosyltransferase n=1 Tax=Ramlibacter sp. 2FC TaxID=2502188 RepID=UPI0010F82ABF|nr:glycosyltransferase [Ramlibacter sp. 2FC]
MNSTTDSKDVVLFATADWDTPYWTNKQHTAHHLALQGYRVLYIESIGLRPPTASGRDLSRIWRRLKRGLRPPRQVEPGVWVMSPIAVPFKQHWPLVRAINQGWLSLRIKLFMQRQGFKLPLIWTYHPFMLGTVARLRRGPMVYHCVDDLSAIPGIDPLTFNTEERRLLRQCETVFVTSEALKDKCLPFNANTHYFPNVADVEHFGGARQPGPLPHDLAGIPCPRIGYVGALSDYKIDFELIHDVAKSRPDWSWILIGEEREGQHNPWMPKLRSLPNVHFLGHKSYQQLPDYLRGIDVGTLPTLLNDYTRSMFPMKYFEYLAAGLPVVSTPLDFTKQHSEGIKVACDKDSYRSAVEEQLRRGKLTSDEIFAYVGENTWRARLNKMLSIVNEHCQRILGQQHLNNSWHRK